MHRLLCFLGIHSWLDLDEPYAYKSRRCRCCDKYQYELTDFV